MPRKRAPRFHGLLLVDKPAGPTSHDVVGWLRWVLNERSIGHCGTLDPAATGLLVVCVGPATKLAGQLTNEDKSYRARFCLGASTTTADAEGEVLEEVAVSDEQRARALEVLGGMTGVLSLAPPAYSAIRVDGVRAHELAREGESVDLPEREMIIRELREQALVAGAPQGRQWVEATLRVSKGSYIRSIAEELGRRLGTPAHLESLRRTQCGPLSVGRPECIQPGARLVEDRWRLGRDLGVEGREGMSELVASKLLEPQHFLPAPCVACEGDAGALEALRRLAMGQKIGLTSPEGQALLARAGQGGATEPASIHFYASGEAAPGGLTLLIEVSGRPPQGAHGAALLPLRVLRFPRPGALSRPAQEP